MLYSPDMPTTAIGIEAEIPQRSEELERIARLLQIQVLSLAARERLNMQKIAIITISCQ
jgi:hypothetical protein